MNCSNCKSPLNDGAQFCGNCGTKVTIPSSFGTITYPADTNSGYPANGGVNYPGGGAGVNPHGKKNTKKVVIAVISIALVFSLVISLLVTGIFAYPKIVSSVSNPFTKEMRHVKRKSDQYYTLQVLEAAYDTVFDSSSLSFKINDEYQTIFSGKIQFGNSTSSTGVIIEDNYYSYSEPLLAVYEGKVLLPTEEVELPVSLLPEILQYVIADEFGSYLPINIDINGLCDELSEDYDQVIKSNRINLLKIYEIFKSISGNSNSSSVDYLSAITGAIANLDCIDAEKQDDTIILSFNMKYLIKNLIDNLFDELGNDLYGSDYELIADLLYEFSDDEYITIVVNLDGKKISRITIGEYIIEIYDIGKTKVTASDYKEVEYACYDIERINNMYDFHEYVY